MEPTMPFDRAAMPREARTFLDDDGRLLSWPAKQKTQRRVIDHLARKFEHGREYTEKEVNFVLMDWHSFGDWALLRRLLYNWGYMDREGDGSRYRLRPEDRWPTLPE